MKLGYIILYVSDVLASLAFFEAAFGLPRRFYHESGYGEVGTGATALGFASHQLGASNLTAGYVKADKSPVPLGMEIALVTGMYRRRSKGRCWPVRFHSRNRWRSHGGRWWPMFAVPMVCWSSCARRSAKNTRMSSSGWVCHSAIRSRESDGTGNAADQCLATRVSSPDWIRPSLALLKTKLSPDGATKILSISPDA